jgi:Ca2+/H+ antiporter, TMEM165/GDT1 family
MDVLLTTFLAAALAEFGDKTQLLVMALAARYGRLGPVLLGVAVAALANSLIAALGGVLLHGFITLRATSLLVALALVFAGVSGLIGSKRPDMGADWKVGAFVTTAACFFLLEFGDKTQFLTVALAAQYNSLVFAAAGATAGVLAASVPAILLGERMAELLPLRQIRTALGGLFLFVGFIVAINALRLI